MKKRARSMLSSFRTPASLTKKRPKNRKPLPLDELAVKCRDNKADEQEIAAMYSNVRGLVIDIIEHGGGRDRFDPHIIIDELIDDAIAAVFRRSIPRFDPARGSFSNFAVRMATTTICGDVKRQMTLYGREYLLRDELEHLSKKYTDNDTSKLACRNGLKEVLVTFKHHRDIIVHALGDPEKDDWDVPAEVTCKHVAKMSKSSEPMVRQVMRGIVGPFLEKVFGFSV